MKGIWGRWLANVWGRRQRERNAGSGQAHGSTRTAVSWLPPCPRCMYYSYTLRCVYTRPSRFHWAEPKATPACLMEIARRTITVRPSADLVSNESLPIQTRSSHSDPGSVTFILLGDERRDELLGEVGQTPRGKACGETRLCRPDRPCPLPRLVQHPDWGHLPRGEEEQCDPHPEPSGVPSPNPEAVSNAWTHSATVASATVGRLCCLLVDAFPIVIAPGRPGRAAGG